ncbi:hypothetical protein CLD22_13115 [Rubrivivax gelatinosus]|nr:hypothetical protein [Rubrivivax gelatinosus]
MDPVSHTPHCLYRVVEVVRGEDGRLKKVYAAYHSDLAYVRRHAVFIAERSVATRLYIADHAGNVVQRLV